MTNVQLVGALMIVLACSSTAAAQRFRDESLLKSPDELKRILEPDIRDVPLHPVRMPGASAPTSVTSQGEVGAGQKLVDVQLRGRELAQTLTCHWLVPAPGEVVAEDRNSQEFFQRDGTWRIDGGRYGARYGTFVVRNDEFCVAQDGQPLRCRKLTRQGEYHFTTIETVGGHAYTSAVQIIKEATASSC